MLIKTENKFFIFLVGFAAISVATWAAIFSVTGLSMLYSGSMLYVAIAMGVLEFSKIIVVSYLYRHWEDTGAWLKTYLTSALILLMLITSGGIYGYLTNSYQGATLGLDKINSQSQVFERQKDNLVAERERLTNDVATLRSERQSTIENRNAEIAANNVATDSSSVKYRAWRNGQVHKRYNIELTNIDNNVMKYITNLDSTNVRLSRIEQLISDKKLELIDTGVDVGPLVYLSRMFNTSMDTIMKWFTLVIVFVFDPLAIALVLALNVIIVNKNKMQYKIGVDLAKPGGDHTAIVYNNKEDAEIRVVLDSIEDDNIENAKPVEQAFADIKKRVRFSEPNKKVVTTSDNELINISMVKDGGEPVKQEKDDIKDVSITDYKYSDVPSTEINMTFGDEEEMDLEEQYDGKYDNEIVDEMLVEAGKEELDLEEQYDKEISPKDIVTPEEVKETFDNAMKEERKKQMGKVSNVMYESGGAVTVDYAIQE